MMIENDGPIAADYFMLSMVRLDPDHNQRIEAVRSVAGDDMEHFLLAPNGELDDLIVDYLGFPANETPIKGGRKFTRYAWDWEYHEMLEGGLSAPDVLARMKRDVAEARAIIESEH